MAVISTGAINFSVECPMAVISTGAIIFPSSAPMAVISTGATIFQANISKPRRPLDTVDLEELPDSRERAGAPVL